MKKERKYFKGLDSNYRGLNDFQYEAGKTYETQDPDPWHWLYFTEHIETAIRYGPVIVEIRPCTQIKTFSKDDMCARSIRIIRELPRDEVLARLMLRPLRKKDIRFCLRQLDMFTLVD